MKKIAKSSPLETAIDTRYLETLMGYNARRAALKAIGLFSKRMVDFGLSQVDFSVLSLIGHSPGITSRNCAARSTSCRPIWSASSARWSSAA